MATARGKAELSDIAADHAREDFELAKITAKQFAPEFIQPGVCSNVIVATHGDVCTPDKRITSACTLV